jgi:hypothetical protein
MARQGLLDLRGVDVVAAPDDDVLGAPGDPDIAVPVPPPEVPGAEPFRRPVLARVEDLGVLGLRRCRLPLETPGEATQISPTSSGPQSIWVAGSMMRTRV